MSEESSSEFAEVRDEADKADARSRRLELIVYTALVAFIVLAIYGFWLITSLTRDVGQLTQEITQMTQVMDRDMSTIAGHMASMDRQMTDINNTMRVMNDEVAVIAGNTQSMDANIGSMTRDTRVMAGSITGMQQDMWSLNRNVGGPMGMMNMFNPFTDQGGPVRGSPGPYYPR
ncbi:MULTISPECIES: hypothetical protein [unclassified Thioalkalivibrio]|uniref:hypothetical protein n=1 Tax=unclassified Thioalkalivibrio TaxID=2621013 RepID=UPI000382BF22|nr:MULTISPECIES: hypothetical protein [unclassified Thioalkalivibrio]